MELPTPPPSLPSAKAVLTSRRPSIRAAPHTRTPSRGRTRTRSRAPPPPLAHTLLSPSRAPQRRLPPPLPLLSPTATTMSSPLTIVGNRTAKDGDEEMLFPMSPVLSQMHAQVQQVQQAHYGVQPQAIWSTHDRLAARGRTRTRGRARTRSFVREVQVIRSGINTVPVSSAFATTVPSAAREQARDAPKETTAVPLEVETGAKSTADETGSEREIEGCGEEGEAEEEDPFLYTFPVFSSSPLVRAQDWRARRARAMNHHHHHHRHHNSSSSSTPCAKNVDLSTFGSGEREMEYFHSRLFGEGGRGRNGTASPRSPPPGKGGDEDDMHAETSLLLSNAFRSDSLSTSATGTSASVSLSARPQESSPPSSVSASSQNDSGSMSRSSSPPEFPPSLFYTPNATNERTPTPTHATTAATTTVPAPARHQHTSTPAPATTSASTSFASYTSRWIPRSLLASFPALTRAGRAGGLGSSPTAAVAPTTTRGDGEGASEKVGFPKLAGDGAENREKGEKEDTSAPCPSPTSPTPSQAHARAETHAQVPSTPVRVRVDELAEYIRARRTVSAHTPAAAPTPAAALTPSQVSHAGPVPVPIYPAKARFGRAREGGVCIPCAGAGAGAGGDREFYAFGDGEMWGGVGDAREGRGGGVGCGEGEDVDGGSGGSPALRSGSGGVERGRTRVNFNSVRAV
ncbi:hypothetical protein BD410DRAFT_173939 [Rickenella mellea]|uniref:Uncharacterized protein n=1 Tax=Rickenella mellea TaxID=50990 RepID=A0A4Y7Q7N6_9AGAM|nr:hypothetical protein BD410DRAFT_173939 [Rickenella mellea]